MEAALRSAGYDTDLLINPDDLDAAWLADRVEDQSPATEWRSSTCSATARTPSEAACTSSARMRSIRHTPGSSSGAPRWPIMRRLPQHCSCSICATPARNRHTINVSIPARTPRSAPLITHQTRLDWLDRCLREQPDTLTYRAAATLLLLYAQPLVRVAAMRCEQIISGPDGISILLGSEPAAVPSPFGELLIDIIGNRPNLQTGNTGTSPWLFPSTRAGQHLHPNTIMTRLRDLGIDLRGARNAALRELVQQVPPPIVASQLGYSPQIALRHAELAAQPNGRYAALTSARLNTARPPQT